jgi:PBP1b-binding outer membrane lipoprotein LpoB
MKRSHLLALITALLLSACMASLTPQGAMVQPVTDAQKERACEFVTIVTASESMGSSTAADAQSAMNKIRNAVAKEGGNGMRIISTTTNEFATTVTAEALKCDFERMRS